MRLADWRQWWRARASDCGALACIALFFACFFPHVLFGHRFIIAGDALYYSYPLRTVAWRMIRQGQLPLWTPYVLSGYPLLAMAQLGLGYPLTWGYLFLPGHWAEQLYVLAPFLLAPAFTYAYAREIGRTRHAALLAGLAYGYGGMMCSYISNSGLLTNSLLWTPLVLLYVDRAQRRSCAHCLLRATGAYALSVLAGHSQSYVYVGTLVVGYGLFLSLARLWQAYVARRDARVLLTWSNWRPFVVAGGALLLSAGVAAFQLLESLRAARRSIRNALTYEVFGEGSFRPREALLSIGAPLYHYVDTSAYLAPLALVCATVALVCAPRGRDVRLWFWLIVAVCAFSLMLGTHTPLYRFVYHVPVLNSFRVPSRHTFEWTLAISILAAYGWDSAAEHFARQRATTKAARKINLFVALALLLLALMIGVHWWRITVVPAKPNPSIYTALAESSYWLWKLAFTVVLCALAWVCFKLTRARLRAPALAVVALLGCFVEPSATMCCWWGWQLSLPAARLQLVAPTTRYLQQFAPEQQRVYTRAELFADEFNPHPRLDAPNLPAVFALHNVAGMEPLILERYSRALGGVGPDSVTPRPGFPPRNDDLFSARSHVLDLLNTTHCVSFANLKPFEDPLVKRDGIGFSIFDLDISLPPGATARLNGGGVADQLALVTSLANSINEAQGTPVARLRLYTTDGRIIERELRAGLDTSEWAHERADVRAVIKHGLAPVFDSRPADAAHSFLNNRYWTRIGFDGPQRIEHIEVINLSHEAALAIWRASLYDSRTDYSTPVAADLRSPFWTTVYAQDRVQIIRNARACPRVWLVSEAAAVDGEEALKRIRGESPQPFDPRRTVLLEVKPDELPALPNSSAGVEGDARIISYAPTQLVIETNAPRATVLVVSELFYPGWAAQLDGQPTRIAIADYLLRGVAVPAGRHTVEMRYTAPAARAGALISGFTLLLLCALFIYERRAARTRAAAALMTKQ